MVRPAVIVHGGAGKWSLVFDLARQKGLEIDEDSVVEGVIAAARAGYRELIRGGTVLDAVTSAIMYMENSGLYNAGIASAMDAAGNITMDAGLMDGANKIAVGIACTRYPKNPILLARKLLGKTDHVILACECADEIARRLGLEKHPGPHPRALAFYEWARERVTSGNAENIWVRNLELARYLGLLGDTVGAVAVDDKGNVAAGVSTGGVNFKLPGRIGDSPIPGAGFYALSGIGGAAATGLGEAIILSSLTSRIVEYLRVGLSPIEAGEKGLRYLSEITGKQAGVVILNADGDYAAVYNTEAMPWALVSGDKVETGLWRK